MAPKKTIDKREGWLRELKVGDQVAIGGWGVSREQYEVGVVERIGPSGNIDVRVSEQTVRTANYTGRLKGFDTWSIHNLVEHTPELQERIRHSKAVRVVSSYLDLGKVDQQKVQELTFDQLDNLYKLLRPLRAEKPE